MPLLYQLCYALEHQVRFSSMPQSNKHIIKSVHKFHLTRNEFYLCYVCLIFRDKQFYWHSCKYPWLIFVV